MEVCARVGFAIALEELKLHRFDDHIIRLFKFEIKRQNKASRATFASQLVKNGVLAKTVGANEDLKLLLMGLQLSKFLTKNVTPRRIQDDSISQYTGPIYILIFKHVVQNRELKYIP